MKRPSNFDHMRHVGAKSPQARQLRKQIRQLELELTQGPAAALPERVDWLKLTIDRAALSRILRRNAALAELDAAERAEAALPASRPLDAGDVVRFTAKALGSMYPVSSKGLCRAPDERWTLVVCACDLCATGRFVATDAGRHVAREGLERCLRSVARARPATAADTEAFLAAEIEQLGVDRVARTVRRP